MARLQRMSAVAPAISVVVLLLLAALASAAAAADAPAKKVRMRFVGANTEAARWLDRYAGTHQQLGAGPIRMRRATAEEAKWLDRMSGNAAGRAEESDNGGDGGDTYIEFDDDNPYIEAVRAWASQLAKRITLEDAQEENILSESLLGSLGNEARHQLAESSSTTSQPQRD